MCNIKVRNITKGAPMKNMKSLLIILFGLTLLTLPAGCKEQGPAEKAGEKIDTMVEKTQDSMKDAGDKIGEGIEKTGEKIEDAGEKLQK